jgi:hypothetical protein
MPDLSFAVESTGPLPDVAAPTLALQLRITNAVAGEQIQAVLLRCQVQILAPRLRYSAEEKERLRDLFGEPERWGQTLTPMLWINTSVNVPAFTESTTCAIPVPCTFDFNVAATKYFYGIEDGEIPATVLFSGTTFYQTQGGLQAAPISWNEEARFKLPVKLWRDMMDAWYPDMAWLHLRRDAFDALYRFKIQQGLPTFEETVFRAIEIAERERKVS